MCVSEVQEKCKNNNGQISRPAWENKGTCLVRIVIVRNQASAYVLKKLIFCKMHRKCATWIFGRRRAKCTFEVLTWLSFNQRCGDGETSNDPAVSPKRSRPCALRRLRPRRDSRRMTVDSDNFDKLTATSTYLWVVLNTARGSNPEENATKSMRYRANKCLREAIKNE